MSISVPYAEFQNARGLLAENGGPWRTELSTDSFCFSSSAGYCQDVGCITCNAYVYSSMRTFSNKIFVNISVPMAQYGNANSLDFTFGYSLDWMSDKTTAGTPLSSRLTVGSTSFTDNFVSIQYYPEPSLGGNPFSHSGTTSVAKSSDGTVGYIPITINFTFTREADSLLDWWMKALGFQITTQTSPGSVTSAVSSTVSSSSTINGSSQTSGARSSSLSNVALPGISQSSTASDISGVSVSSASLPNSGPSVTNNKSTSAIVGGVVGGFVLLGALAILFLLLYKRKMRRLEQKHSIWKNKERNAGFEHLGGGEDQLMRTPFSEGFPPSPSPRMDDVKSPIFPDISNAKANPDSTVLSVTSASSPATPLYRSDHTTSQSSGHRRSRGHERHRPPSDYASALHPEAPPPAYSDVNAATNDHGHERGYEEDEEEGSPPENRGGALPTR
ncbi:hypothetical protein FRC20_002230 [Serendipita sp. 405]|nr:hypothetical protein FRC15_003644 [Serendipita sp. 397]KAG8779492.1 hypothetical protein FRC16_003411 [Serendipita sp. 398]KAG8849778.1 hypothetical protein FRC20_002230 [Serendipita sp. 405]